MSSQYKRRLPTMPCIDQALAEAVVHSDIAEVRQALQAGAFVNGLDHEGLGAIHQAIYENKCDVLRLLVRHGADVRLRDSEGWTPLHTAAQTGNCEMARFLLKEGANTDAVDGDGLFPIDRAESSDMRSLLHRAMKRAGHVRLSNQYRMYLEQELILEGSVGGDTDSLCSTASAYSLSPSEDEGQFSQSDGDELQSVLIQDAVEEKSDLVSPCGTLEQSVLVSKQRGHDDIGDKVESKKEAQPLSACCPNNGEESENATASLVKVKVFEKTPSLASVEVTVQREFMTTPELSFVCLAVGGSPDVNHSDGTHTREVQKDREESAGKSHFRLAGEEQYGSSEGVDKECYRCKQEDGTTVYQYQLPGDQIATRLVLPYEVEDRESHILCQQLGASRQEPPNETSAGDRMEMTEPAPLETAISRSQLRTARVAFFRSPQPNRKSTSVTDKSGSLSPVMRRAQSGCTTLLTPLVQTETKGDSSSRVEDKETEKVEVKEGCTSVFGLPMAATRKHVNVNCSPVKPVEMSLEAIRAKQTDDLDDLDDLDVQLPCNQDAAGMCNEAYTDGSDLVTSESYDKGIPTTQDLKLYETVQSFGWESSDDDMSGEETVVFFRVDEAGSCVRKHESDNTSTSSLFSPDSDPPAALQSSVNPDEFRSLSSVASSDSECENQEKDNQPVIEDASTCVQACSSDVIASVKEDKEGSVVLRRDRQKDEAIKRHHDETDGNDGEDRQVRVRNSPPRPQSLCLSVENTVSHSHPPWLKSSMKEMSLPDLTVFSRPKASLNRRSVTFEPVVRFQDAVVIGDMEEVKSLIRTQSVNLDVMTPQGYSLLHTAAIEGNISCISTLIHSGANVNIQDEDGWTPLHAASSHGHLDIVQYLLKNGADACIVGNSQETAYDVVDEEAGPLIEQILKDAMGDQFELLVTGREFLEGGEHSEDGDDEESDEENASSPDDCEESSTGVVFHTSRLTLSADIGKRSSHSSKLATSETNDLSVTDNDCDAIAEPLEQQLDDDDTAGMIDSVVHCSAAQETACLDRTNDSESERNDQAHIPTKPHRGVLVRQLRMSPTRSVETPDGPLSPKTVSFPPSVLLQQAVADGDIVEVEKLLEQYTPEQLQINSVLLASGVSVLQQSVNTENLDMVKLLINKGSADPSLQDADGWTALHNAAAVGNCVIARYLISYGAKLSVVTGKGQFPSDVADSHEMASLLKSAMLGRVWGTSFKGSL